MSQQHSYRFLVNTDPAHFEVRDLATEPKIWNQIRLYRSKLFADQKYLPLYDLAALKRWLHSNNQLSHYSAEFATN